MSGGENEIESAGPKQLNGECMWELMKELFPLHRTLVGPGINKSFEIIRNRYPVNIQKFPSGTKCFDWTIPQAFKVNSAYVEAPDGNRPIDFEKCNHHVWNYSQPFSGYMDRDELVKKINTLPSLPYAVPLKVTYYRKKWGLCASQNQIDRLPDGKYKVHIDTEFYDDFLRIAECYLPGESEEEILLTSYLCHPMGANDNLSGVVILLELFKLLGKLKKRRFSYRLAIWPETIGAITYIYHFPENIKKTIGGYVLTCVGDPGAFNYKKSYSGDSMIDRAAIHSLKHSNSEYNVINYHHHRGSDELRFNGVGLRIPFGSIMRTPYAKFPQYHSTADDMTFVTPEALLGSLKVYWKTLMILEKNIVYQPNFVVDPFMTAHGIFPFTHGAGEGRPGSKYADAYFHLIGHIDGQNDLLSLAEKTGEDIDIFDAAVSDFVATGLIKESKWK